MREIDNIAINLDEHELRAGVIAAINIAVPCYRVLVARQRDVSQSFSVSTGIIYGVANCIATPRQAHALERKFRIHVVSCALHCVMEFINNPSLDDDLVLDTVHAKRAFAYLGEMACLSPQECNRVVDESGITESRFCGNVIDLAAVRRK